MGRINIAVLFSRQLKNWHQLNFESVVKKFIQNKFKMTFMLIKISKCCLQPGFIYRNSACTKAILAAL